MNSDVIALSEDTMQEAGASLSSAKMAHMGKNGDNKYMKGCVRVSNEVMLNQRDPDSLCQRRTGTLIVP